MIRENISEKSLWIFDLDGTLTRPVHDFTEIRRQLGIPQEADILAYLDSLPADDAYQRHLKLARIELELACASEVAAGVQDCLRWLADKTRFAVLTRNTRANALLSLEAIGLRSLFSEGSVLGRDEALPKPDPDGIVKLMKRFCVTPQDTVMTGDFLHDLAAGRAAGVTTVHIDFRGSFSWSEYADHEFDNFMQLHQHLLNTP